MTGQVELERTLRDWAQHLRANRQSRDAGFLDEAADEIERMRKALEVMGNMVILTLDEALALEVAAGQVLFTQLPYHHVAAHVTSIDPYPRRWWRRG